MSDHGHQPANDTDDQLIKELQALCRPRSAEETKRRKTELAEREFQAMKRCEATKAGELAELKMRALEVIRKNRESQE